MIGFDPDKVREREWPGPGGKSIQVEIGGFGMAAPVTVLASHDFSTAYVSVRDLKHASLEDASDLAACVIVAMNYVKDRRNVEE